MCPEANVRFGGQSFTLMPNPRAWYTLEVDSGKPFLDTLEQSLDGRVRHTCEIVWALSATSRSRSKFVCNQTQEEKQRGYLVPGEFLDILPHPGSQEWKEIRFIVSDLAIKAGIAHPVAREEKPSEQPGPPE